MVAKLVLQVQKRRRGRRRSTTANRGIPDGLLAVFCVNVVLPLLVLLLVQLFEVPPMLVLVSAGWMMPQVNTFQQKHQRELHHQQLSRTRRRPSTMSCNLRPIKKNNIDKPPFPSNSAAVTTSQTIKAATHDTALAVVPPDEAWDRLQRARFLAQDGSYTTWPPAIRLFHPFVTSPIVLHERALQVARIVEDYDVTRFPVTLSEWSIVPHEEALQAYHFLQQEQQQFFDDDNDNSSTRNSHGNDAEQSQDIQALIESEERIGREKYAQRQRRLGRKPRNPEHAAGTLPDSNSTVPVAPTKPAPPPRLDKEQRQYEHQQATQLEFNGPCVLCLEPDEASREQLQALRYLLRCELPDAEHYAEEYSPSGSMPLAENTATRPIFTPPSSSTAAARHHHHHERRRPRRPTSKNKNDPATFRPLVPIAAFDTVSRAIPVARRLRRLWEPLTFNVTDLQFMAYCASTGTSTPSGSSTRLADTTTTTADDDARTVAESSWGGGRGVDYAASAATTRNGQFVCEALVYLVGEEEISMVEEEEELLNRDMARWVWEQGLSGGHVVNKNNHNSTVSKDPIKHRPASWNLGIQLEENRPDDNDSAQEEEVEAGMRSELEEWLLADDEDEDDEGAIVVLGRTHFFTGGMRHYVGMPASSALDRLRSGSSSGGVGDSATARRRGSTPATAFDDGDFGAR